MDRPRPALRREARHAGHLDRRPHRGGRPDQGRRGPLPCRRADDSLRPAASHQPRHLRHQRATGPRRTDPGRTAEHHGREGRADPRVPSPPAARPVCDRERQPRGLHLTRSNHHTPQRPLWFPGAHALPAEHRRRAADHGGGKTFHSRGLRAHLSFIYEGDRRRADTPCPAQPTHLAVVGRLGAHVDRERRKPREQCGASCRAGGRAARRAAHHRPRISRRLNRRTCRDRSPRRRQRGAGAGPSRARCDQLGVQPPLLALAVRGRRCAFRRGQHARGRGRNSRPRLHPRDR